MTGEGFIHTAHLVQPLVINRPEDIVPAILAKAGSVAGGDADVIEKM